MVVLRPYPPPDILRNVVKSFQVRAAMWHLESPFEASLTNCRFSHYAKRQQITLTAWHPFLPSK